MGTISGCFLLPPSQGSNNYATQFKTSPAFLRAKPCRLELQQLPHVLDHRSEEDHRSVCLFSRSWAICLVVLGVFRVPSSTITACECRNANVGLWLVSRWVIGWMLGIVWWLTFSKSTLLWTKKWNQTDLDRYRRCKAIGWYVEFKG